MRRDVLNTRSGGTTKANERISLLWFAGLLLQFVLSHKQAFQALSKKTGCVCPHSHETLFFGCKYADITLSAATPIAIPAV